MKCRQLLLLVSTLFFTNCGTSKPKFHLVNFDANGGTYISSQIVEDGQHANKPDDPMRSNYIFQGWYLGDNKFDFSTEIKNDITLKADWVFDDYDDTCEFLTFNAEKDSHVSYSITGSHSVNMQYSYDMVTWNEWSVNQLVEVPKNQKIYVKNLNDHLSTDDRHYVNFNFFGKIAASGSVNSLFQANKIGEYEFYKLFSSSATLVRAPLLPSATLSFHSYDSMFMNCYGLVKAPKILATTYSDYSCANMFDGCSSLKEIPELNVSTLFEYSCSHMFSNCISLKSFPILKANDLAPYCYEYMFSNCYLLEHIGGLPATSLKHHCYSHMFEKCYSLIETPELPAINLATYCYENMFDSCTNLAIVHKLPATNLSAYCYLYMFSNCASLKDVSHILSATNLAEGCYKFMFVDCGNLVEAPEELPVTTLAEECYRQMFYNCGSLKKAPYLPATDISATNCYQQMFMNCYSLENVSVGFGTPGKTDWPTNRNTSSWLYRAGQNAKNPTFTWKGSDALETGDGAKVPSGWTVRTAS